MEKKSEKMIKQNKEEKPAMTFNPKGVLTLAHVTMLHLRKLTYTTYAVEDDKQPTLTSDRRILINITRTNNRSCQTTR